MGLDIAWTLAERDCWFLTSAVHTGRGDLEPRSVVRMDVPRRDEELEVARGNERSIAEAVERTGGITRRVRRLWTCFAELLAAVPVQSILIRRSE